MINLLKQRQDSQKNQTHRAHPPDSDTFSLFILGHNGQRRESVVFKIVLERFLQPSLLLQLRRGLWYLYVMFFYILSDRKFLIQNSSRPNKVLELLISESLQLRHWLMNFDGVGCSEVWRSKESASSDFFCFFSV